MSKYKYLYILVHALLLLWWGILWCSVVVVAHSGEEVTVVWLQNKTFDAPNWYGPSRFRSLGCEAV